jgi:cytochrome c peroxidase
MTLLLTLSALLGCSGPSPEAAPQGWTPTELRTLSSLRLQTEPPDDPTNRFIGNEAAIRLGSALFFDPGLSAGNDVSCATCHDPGHHFSDPKRFSQGVGETGRHAPTIPGSQWGEWMYWDGRADSQWMQAAGPIEHPDEMASDRVFAAKYAMATYPELWEAAFGPAPDLSDLPDRAGPIPDLDDGAIEAAWTSLTPEQQRRANEAFVLTLKAIGAWEHTLVPQEAPFDRYVDAVVAGDPSGAGHLSDDAVRGLELFVRDANCVDCHLGPMFTDRAFHNLGLPEDKAGYDQGRTVGAMQVAASELNCAGPYSDAEACPELDFLNPTFDDFISAFKTPSLRDVTRSAPYMHNGLFASLDEVLAFYSELPGQPIGGHRELTLQPLNLEPDEVEALKAFLASLEGGVLPDDVVRPLN